MNQKRSLRWDLVSDNGRMGYREVELDNFFETEPAILMNFVIGIHKKNKII